MYLNNHSYYSLRYGTISEVELLEIARKEKCKEFVLTDINNTSACLNFIRKAQEASIKPIVGVDFRNGVKQCYVALAYNNEGFLEINDFLSEHLHAKSPFPDLAPPFNDVAIIYTFENILKIEKTTFQKNEFIGITIKDLNKFRFSPLQEHRDRLVILHTVSFRDKRDFNTHRLLRAIDRNMLLSMLPESEQGSPDQTFINKKSLSEYFKDFPHLITNTKRLLKKCAIDFNFKKNKPSQNLSTFLGNAEDDYKKLVQLAKEGLPKRYGKNGVTYKIKRRLVKELNVIKSQNYVAFFLINWRIIEYARSKDYFYVGRGSGANSIVAYLLRITDVDPIELDLYFERFMNIYRATPPDFDIDFSTWDREDVTSFIFKEFNHHNQVALLGAYVTFKHSGAVRELGKVFGLPKHEIDKLSDGRYTINSLDNIRSLVLKYSKILHNRPNYVSIHAAGILISDKPIHYFSATNMPPKGFPTVQFDMHIAEDVGLYKFDILGQRGLGKIKDAVAIVKENHPEIDLPDIHNATPFFKDEKINKMISRAECIGCFYVESPAMRMLLKKLAVNDYLTLVAASSIIRPGVSKSGMMREYILRHKNPERIKEAHPVLLEIMPDTYGVMVYQEDVIKVAHYYAGLDLGEADVLRRGMSGKYRSREEFLQVKAKFKSNCISRGEPEATVDEVWRQIESFAGYAFAKGHSASYAVESYQSLFLKCYYPLEYMVATINNGGGFYRTETYVHEARMLGGIIHPPCINRGQIHTTIRGKDIFLGLQHIQGLEKQVMIEIINCQNNSPFTSLDNFKERVQINLDQLDLLVRINAFRSINKDKRALLWEAHYKENSMPVDLSQQALFKTPVKNFRLPDFPITDLERAFDQLELLSFPLFDPFLILEEIPTTNLLARDLEKYLNKVIIIYGYLVTAKNTSTSKGDRMSFGTFIDHSGEWIDTVHFPQSVKSWPFKGKGIYRITGKVVSEFNFLTLEVQKLERMSYVPDARFAGDQRKSKKIIEEAIPFHLLR